MTLLIVILLAWLALTLLTRTANLDRVAQHQSDPYLDALKAAQRIHTLAWTARQAMIEEARRSLEP